MFNRNIQCPPRKRSVFKGQNTSYLMYCLQYAAVGIIVGLVICAFRSAARGEWVSLQNMLMNIMFSVVITLSIANSVYLFQVLLLKDKVKAWQLMLFYYGCNIIGMLTGIEIAYLLVSLIFHQPFNFLKHYPDYRFSGLIVVVVGTIIYLYHAQKSGLENRIKEKELDLAKLQQLKTQAELQTLQSKINPHFLYNSLNSIASLIHEDADKAEDMTLKLSKLFRYSINSQQANMATVAEEMEIVNTYLDIEKVRFGNRINFTSQIGADVQDLHIPRFLIQPLVENALKHGLHNTTSNGLLHIMADRDGDELVVTIFDNGQPFPDDINMGYGLQSTYDKLNLLCGDDHRIQISNHPQKHIKITIPANL